ncbi:MAG: NADH-quinone oxidoreductase subunit H [Planctomycetes bacterium]|nr:NADH-quinone oxidoreductase subunit H [Planctomycetota bacterium]
MTRIIQLVLSPLIALVVGVLLLGLSRKIIARIHRRYGPPIYQPVIDVIRMMSQRSISHGSLFDLGVVFALAGSLVTVMFIPLGGTQACQPFAHGVLCPLSSSGGLLVVMYLMLLGPLGLALGAGDSANPNASIGVSRKLLLALAYEVPFLLVILAVMSHYETISLTEIVARQQQAGWGALSVPLSAVAAFLILPAMLGVRPFDLVSAPQEIASGPMAEYGGRSLALIKLYGATHLFLVIALFVDLFLGGGVNLATFLLKMLIVFMAVEMINAVLPRVKIEDAIKFCWKWPAGLALLQMAITVLSKSG